MSFKFKFRKRKDFEKEEINKIEKNRVNNKEEKQEQVGYRGAYCLKDQNNNKNISKRKRNIIISKVL